MDALILALQCAAILQLLIAALNLGLVPLLNWQRPLAGVPLLLREVFHVHTWFISLTVTMFALLTLCFATDMVTAAHPLASGLCTCLAVFWGFRLILQCGYYSPSHWHRMPCRTVAHACCMVVFSAFTITYALAALRGM